MQILSMQYQNVRNLKDDSISFHSSINVFYGKNGQGKTSILEALYCGATGLSFRTKHGYEMIRYHEDYLASRLRYQDRLSEKEISVLFQQKKKSFFYFDKKLSQMQYYGGIKVIFYIPEDVFLINGSPQTRRLFLDREVSQLDLNYLESLKKFAYAHKLRNKYLKEKRTEQLEYQVYEEDFIHYGAYIIQQRHRYIKKISALLATLYRDLFDETKELALEYKASFPIGDIEDLESIKADFRHEIQKKHRKEKDYGQSLCGPHKDDFYFLLNEEEARFFSSQGEKKSIIFALKLSEIDMIYQEKKELPILLIDDITSYFDSLRRKSVLEYLRKKEVQVFLTSTEHLDMEARHYYIEKGEVYEGSTLQTFPDHRGGAGKE